MDAVDLHGIAVACGGVALTGCTLALYAWIALRPPPPTQPARQIPRFPRLPPPPDPSPSMSSPVSLPLSHSPVSAYGFCPTCFTPGESRERRPNGNDRCTNGHTYPSVLASPTPFDSTHATTTLAPSLTGFEASLLVPIADRWWMGVQLNVDGYTFTGCRFDRCTLTSRTGVFRITNCALDAETTVNSMPVFAQALRPPFSRIPLDVEVSGLDKQTHTVLRESRRLLQDGLAFAERGEKTTSTWENAVRAHLALLDTMGV